MLNKMIQMMMIGMLLTVFTTSYALAQEQNEAFQPGQMLADLKARLNLTDDQSAQLRPIMQAYGAQLRELVEKYKEEGFLGRRAMKEDFQKIRDEFHQQLKPILTVTQMEALETFQEEMRQKAEERTRAQIINKLAERLNLNEIQAEQVASILAENLTKRRDLIEKYRGQGLAGFRAFRKENQQLRETTEQQLAAILTSEQMEAYKALQEELLEKIRAEFQ